VTPNLRPRDELIEYFANLGRQGFKRKGLLWYRHADETSFSFELQRSSYSTLYFANLGVSFAAVGGTPELRPHRCHLYGRLPHVDALDFSRDIASGQRATALDEFQARVVLPAANACATAAGAAEFLRSGVLSAPLITQTARRLLGLDA